MTLSPRERRALGGGGPIVAVLLLYLLLWSGDSAPPPSVELVQAPPTRPPPPSPMPAQNPVAPPPADASQLRLVGLLGNGAIIATADGNQRYVPLGREVMPGITLRRLEVHHAILDSAGGEIRLGFDGAAQGQAPPPGQPAAAPAAESALRDEALRYQLGLAPRMANGRVSGFTVRPGAELPALARAGIRPGDVIVSVNGSAFDEERMTELAWQIANSARTDFEVERGGRRFRLSLQGR